MVAASSAADLPIPSVAIQYFPILTYEVKHTMNSEMHPSALAAQIEQETCTSLRSKHCWNPRARNFIAGREEGIGLGQVTRTWKNGSLRFDTLTELKSQDSFLSSWSWEDPYNPRYQLRGLALLDKRCLNHVDKITNDGTNKATAQERLAMAFSCYNGGPGGLTSDLLVCKAVREHACDTTKWWGNVELFSKKSRVARLYRKSNFEINREYVRNILKVRIKKYQIWDWSSNIAG